MLFRSVSQSRYEVKTEDERKGEIVSRTDGFGKELYPTESVPQTIVDEPIPEILQEEIKIEEKIDDTNVISNNTTIPDKKIEEFPTAHIEVKDGGTIDITSDNGVTKVMYHDVVIGHDVDFNGQKLLVLDDRFQDDPKFENVRASFSEALEKNIKADAFGPTPIAEVFEGGKIYVSYGVPDKLYRDWETDRKSTRLNSSHEIPSRMPSSA